MDVKLPKKTDWVTVSYKRALKDRRASVNLEAEEDDEMLSTMGAAHVVEEDEVEEEARGASGSGGTVTLTSWRAPVNRK